MVWFTNQSLLLIALAFLLGLLVGYLWWGLRLRRVRSAESTTDAAPLAATAPAAVVAAEPLTTTPASAASDPTPTATPTPEPVATYAAEPAPAEPPTEPIAADPVVIEPTTAEPTTADAAAAEPVAEPVVAGADVSEPAESKPEPVAEPVAESAAEPVSEPVVSEPAEAAPVAGAVPVATATAVDDALVAEVESAFEAGAPAAHDDLERIEGIGPKIAAALRAAGITTYAQLADAERSTVEDALSDANLRFAPSLATWGRQARLLADGDEAGFNELTARLVAGREVAAKPAPNGAVPAATEVDAEAALSTDAPAEAQVDAPAEAQVDAPTETPVDTAVDTEVDEDASTSVTAEPEVAVVAPAEEPVDAATVTDVDAEPVVAADAGPVADVDAEPVAEAEAEADAEPVAEVEAEPAAVVVPAQARSVEESPVEVPADDLKRIEGIGPKMSAALVAAGIRTFAQLGASDVDTLRGAIEAAGLRFAPSIVTWARQAQLLADGNEEGFAELTQRLVAGRDTGRG